MNERESGDHPMTTTHGTDPRELDDEVEVVDDDQHQPGFLAHYYAAYHSDDEVDDSGDQHG